MDSSQNNESADEVISSLKQMKNPSEGTDQVEVGGAELLYGKREKDVLEEVGISVQEGAKQSKERGICNGSTLEHRLELAVEVNAAKLLFGKSAQAEGLHDITLGVQKGTIYALLGPSGCGKTTLLCSLVGLKYPQSGLIRVFGHSIGVKGSGIPGPWVGYMPQDLCLYSELTTEETLRYFGSLHRMSGPHLQERTDFLLTLLDIPRGRQTATLSGGQKRRLSLATALVHDPPLLLLDEPTVGVDPVLRKTIWGHLCYLSKELGKTVLITTHYIEEAGKANKVGFMRAGRILVEDSPQMLKDLCRVSTLEEVFLKLCMDEEDAIGKINDKPVQTTSTGLTTEGGIFNPAFECDVPEIENEIAEECSKKLENGATCSLSRTQSDIGLQKMRSSDERKTTSQRNGSKPLPKLNGSFKDFCLITLAILWKDLSILRKNWLFLVIAFLSPLSNVILAKLLLNHDPFGLAVAVVNNDYPPIISKSLIHHLDKYSLDLRNYSDLGQAMELLKSAEVQAVLYIGPTFSRDILKRIRLGLATDNATVRGSTLRIISYNVNLQVDRVVQNTVFKAFSKMADDAVQNLGVEPGASKSALVFEKPVLGTEHTDHSDYVVLNMLPDSLFMMSMALSAIVFVSERCSGLLDRSRVSGVSPFQILLSHCVILTLVTFIQISLLAVFILCFGVEVRGSYLLLLTLLYQASYVGMAIGTFVSAVTRSTHAALLITVLFYWCSGSFSGIIWPVESHPPIMREITQAHPCNWNYRAVFRVMANGAGLSHSEVWRSVLMSSGWTLALLLAATLLFKRSL